VNTAAKVRDVILRRNSQEATRRGDACVEGTITEEQVGQHRNTARKLSRSDVGIDAP
jgi:hypothetical protein